MIDWLIAIQRWLYGGMAEGMRSTVDVTGLPTLMAAAFLFGIVHAFMPGHGKTVLVSYHLGRQGRITDGLLTGTLLAITHVGIAVVFVLAGVAVISRSLADGGRAPAFEKASAGLIALIGLYLVARTIWPHRHEDVRDGKMLALVTGLVPCPLTTFILTYALVKGKLAIGLAAVAGMLAGVIVTLVAFSVTAVAARGRFVALLSRTENWRRKVGWSLEFAGALAVLAIGLIMLARQLGLLPR
jgi:nickel/cobalt exporter